MKSKYDSEIKQKLRINRAYSEAFEQELQEKSNGMLHLIK